MLPVSIMDDKFDRTLQLAGPVPLLLRENGEIEALSPRLSAPLAVDGDELAALIRRLQGGSSSSASPLVSRDPEGSSGTPGVLTRLVGEFAAAGFLLQPGESQHDHRPIFVLGAPRSGTTLVRQMLDAHPRIACGPESVVLCALRDLFRGGRLQNHIAPYGLADADVLSFFRGFFCHIHALNAARSKKPRWADKTTAYSAIPDFVHELFGRDARYVVVVRHGLDVVASMIGAVEDGFWTRNMGGFADAVVSADNPFESAARIWATLADRLYRFHRRNAEDVFVLQYEALVKAPQATVSALFAFLREQVPRGYLENLFEHRLDNQHRGGSGDYKLERKRHVDPSSVGRWRSLDRATIESVADIVNPSLTRWGYDPV